MTKAARAGSRPARTTTYFNCVRASIAANAVLEARLPGPCAVRPLLCCARSTRGSSNTGGRTSHQCVAREGCRAGWACHHLHHWFCLLHYIYGTTEAAASSPFAPEAVRVCTAHTTHYKTGRASRRALHCSRMCTYVLQIEAQHPMDSTTSHTLGVGVRVFAAAATPPLPSMMSGGGLHTADKASTTSCSPAPSYERRTGISKTIARLSASYRPDNQWWLPALQLVDCFVM